MIRPRGGEGNYPHIIRMGQGLNNTILLIHIIRLDSIVGQSLTFWINKITDSGSP